MNGKETHFIYLRGKGHSNKDKFCRGNGLLYRIHVKAPGFYHMNLMSGSTIHRPFKLVKKMSLHQRTISICSSFLTIKTYHFRNALLQVTKNALHHKRKQKRQSCSLCNHINLCFVFGETYFLKLLCWWNMKGSHYEFLKH